MYIKYLTMQIFNATSGISRHIFNTVWCATVLKCISIANDNQRILRACSYRTCLRYVWYPPVLFDGPFIPFGEFVLKTESHGTRKTMATLRCTELWRPLAASLMLWVLYYCFYLDIITSAPSTIYNLSVTQVGGLLFGIGP